MFSSYHIFYHIRVKNSLKNFVSAKLVKKNAEGRIDSFAGRF